MKHTSSKCIGTLFIFGSLLFLVSCKRDSDIVVDGANEKTHTKKYSAEVAQKWLDLQLRILRLAGATPTTPGANPYSLNGNRQFAYMGIALYESVLPGMPSQQSLYGQLTAMPAMPDVAKKNEYHWPTSANAALAFLTKKFYTVASAANKAAMDSLEAALNGEYQQQVSPEDFQRSKLFGQDVAQRIFNWAQADGSQTNYPAYVPTTDPAKWSNTAPNPTAVFAPYWGLNRQFVPGSFDNTAAPLPPPYSTDPTSAYYSMVKEVYDISQVLTEDQKALALYFRDNPGFQAGTHYQSIFSQVMGKENLTLDEFAMAQAKVGIAMAESQINCWQQKYSLLVDRPTKYIRNVLGHTTWSSFLAMPPHPDYPSGHSQTGGAFAAAMTHLFGDNYAITLHTYDNLGMAPRFYSSFSEMTEDIGRSRVYGGIHYTYSCVEGQKQGEKIGANILNKLKFLKE